MSAVFSAIAAVTIASVAVQQTNARKARKQAERFNQQEQKRITEQAEQARVAANLNREKTETETATIQDTQSDKLVSTGRRKRAAAPSGNISSSLGL